MEQTFISHLENAAKSSHP